MKAVFIFDTVLVKKDNDYFGMTLTYEFFKNRYLSFYDEITVATRFKTADKVKGSIDGYKITNGENVNVVPVQSYKEIPDSIKNRSKIITELTDIIKNSDKVIIRMPSVLGIFACNICQKLNKEYLIEKKYNPKTINGILSAINKFLTFVGQSELKVKYLRIQRQLFRHSNKELTQAEYLKLINKAQELGKERLSLLMQTICATGIRVSELKYITVETVKAGKAEISLKGKIRTILLTGKLCKKLLKYAKHKKITSGEIFITRSGRGLGRKQIWAEMKALCKKSGV